MSDRIGREFARTAEEWLRRSRGYIEETIRMCLSAGFAVSHIEEPTGHPDAERPVIVRGDGGRELARWWMEYDPDKHQMRLSIRMAEDVKQALRGEVS